MKRRIITFFLAVLLCLTAASTVFAESAVSRVVDDAGLFTQQEKDALSSALDEVSQKQGADIVVVTVSTLDGSSPMDYADDFYDYNGYAEDGVLLLISIQDRDSYISTRGSGIRALNDAKIEHILDEIAPDLSEGRYAEAGMSFARLCDECFTQAQEDAAFPFALCLLFALAVGFVVALIVTGHMKRQLKSVRAQYAAGSYVRANSMNVTESHELFLYHRVSRHPKPQNNGSGGARTHISSSGHVHGGGGRKF